MYIFRKKVKGFKHRSSLGHNKKSENFDTGILEEGALYKSLNVKKKTPDEKQPWKTIHEVMEDDYFNESKVKNSKEFLMK